MTTASRRAASPAPRRVLAIKRADGEPLTRADIQYDLLHAIFANDQAVFTDPHTPPNPDSPPPKITFKDLYIKSIYNSPKATKALKDKMKELPAFSLDFAMLSLLVNVGRVNTTMSFFPEMKTAIRTYHPVPALQHTNGNMQDAPRIKHILKTSLLDTEAKNPPSTPGDILTRCKSGQPPSTSVTNLLFVLAHHTGPIGQAHFQGALDFLDLFLRTDISSASRARAFLWLCFNYLEAPSIEDDYDGDFTPNPFSEAAQSSGLPSLVYLSPEESASENQETVEDKFTSDKLLAQRIKIVTNQTAKELSKATNKDSANVSLAGDDESDEHKPKPKKGAKLAIKDRKAMVPTISIKPSLRTTSDPLSHLADLDDGSDSDQLMDEFMRQRHLSRSKSFEFPTNGLALRQNGIGRRFAPYEIKEHDRTRHRSRHLSQPRTMLQQAWHAVNSTDALLDSDDEEGDEYMREDYIQRLRVIDRLAEQPWIQDPTNPLDMAVEQ